ncbi:hypothetical protein AB0B04_18590 [Streptomyces xinghaiensis]|uniref:Uncharacterized protein n=2 Tax=Streptomyces TaxID=1883 RepID=A0A3M8EX77_9ACTN|nr:MULTISPECIES: hypothetical protein [Streptomyces]KNE81424.1 hypothetical protein ADZ36_16795 [Streptomyces fradiae]OFA48228.1 hypothetical protein BEN35_18970 [Streptomyces fradiae]PQM20706.1 hypothetical protein Sfr7A_26355 [Streptomyces xinghaiensis]RKM92647.1 hypothetical protein SFRA_025010 [Streptomyces xinghaiensis]RNC70615.1 hypothetical protein DC095_026000 [Streptomyces xinghaiensis]
MSTHPGPAAGADLARLALDFHHTHQLLDPAAQGVQTWEVRITAAGTPVGRLTAVRGLYWKSDNLRERMVDDQSFPALVAAQLLDEEGHFTHEFEEFIESASSVLVVDRLRLEEAFADPVVVAVVVAAVIDRLTDNYFAVVLPAKNACTDAGSALLAEAGVLLSAQEFSDELQIIDNALAAPEEAAQRVRSRLRSLARHGRPADWDEDDEDDGWDEDGEEGEELTARTAAVLRVALEELSGQIWQDVAAVGDAPLGRGEGRVLGSLPPIIFRQDRQWRRQMARCFDDLAADLAGTGAVRPLCTGEEMALHLGIDRAKSLTRNRSRLVAKSVEGLDEDRRDFDWDWCSSVLFEDHDVLMLFDASLDGIEDSGSEVNQALGLANLAAADWFEPFRPGQARDPDRGFRHP